MAKQRGVEFREGREGTRVLRARICKRGIEAHME